MFSRLTLALLALLLTSCATTPPPRLTMEMGTAGAGGAFSPYGEAFARVVAAHSHVDIKPRVTRGSNENIDLMVAGTTALGLVNLGPALDAVSGQGAWKGKPVAGLRAITPMYETPFHLVALRNSGISTLAGLAGKRVGAGPRGGPGEIFLTGLLAETGVQATLVSGDPADHGKQLLAREIDALWIGAGTPVPVIKGITDQHEATVFGLTVREVEAFRKRFPYAAPNTINALTYRGQAAPVQTVAIWNFVAGRADLPERDVKAIALAAMKNHREMAALFGPASATQAVNAHANGVMPFHPGALAALRELGVRPPP
jgi:TRAP transporter TAXI family solute receptor